MLNLSKIVNFVATGFWVGKVPWAPGTFGTLLAIPLVWALQKSGPFPYMVASLLITIGAIFLCEWQERVSGTHDSREVVIDEVAGFLITMTWLPPHWQAYVVGFALFRFLDAVKPFPISWLDRNVKGGFGVVLDDVAAGIVANIALQVLYLRTDWLGHQLIFPR